MRRFQCFVKKRDGGGKLWRIKNGKKSMKRKGGGGRS